MKVFADGADIQRMKEALLTHKVDGFTTNPSLMVKAGISDYLEFAKKAVSELSPLPISFEVFSDEFDDMYDQALILSDLGDNVYVKIPVTNTKDESSYGLIRSLSQSGVKVNVTAIFTEEQVVGAYDSIDHSTPSVISVFAGRIADTLRDPEPMMRQAAAVCSSNNCELLWASTREAINILHASRSGCDIITVPDNILYKFSIKGKSLKEYSLETVKMFFRDASSAGYSL